MELYASNLFFRGDNEKQQAYDCCIHGNIIFKIEDTLLSDNSEWCVSASAYRFLHTLFDNHFMGAEDFLIPCCGHTMITSDDGLSVTIIGCNNGIDFNIIHEDDNIVIITAMTSSSIIISIILSKFIFKEKISIKKWGIIILISISLILLSIISV